jgi:hypothetical protein
MSRQKLAKERPEKVRNWIRFGKFRVRMAKKFRIYAKIQFRMCSADGRGVFTVYIRTLAHMSRQKLALERPEKGRNWILFGKFRVRMAKKFRI